MLTELKVSFLVRKCVFYRRGDPMELNFEGLEMQKWNIPTNRAQRADEKKKKKKNRASWLVIMLTPGVMVIKMCKMAHFLCFLLMPAKISHSVDKIFTCIWKILNGSFRKCYRLLDSELPLARYQPWSFVIFFAEICFFDISTLHISRTVTLKPINHTIFGKNSKRSFRCI